MEQFAKETLPISLEDEMRTSYLDYAMSVIVGRALPSAADGLKPVHRRILFAMGEANNVFNRPYVKSARVVGEVMGKLHPHGDSAIYDALVRMAQEFSLRYPLIDGQGNFGSVDGDNAAAMRYTECRLEKISGDLLADIDKETVDFIPNYDGKELEPVVLPTRIPNLLVNGSSGIAVGMATNIPPHNLGEIVDACLMVLNEPKVEIDQLIECVPGPDFPTKGIIYGTVGIREAYKTGRGRVVMRARTHFEDLDKSAKQAIVVDELPYQVNKSTLLMRIGELVRSKKLDGISEIRDESDKSGMRVVLELKRGEVPEVTLNNLYKDTQMQDTFGVNMVALTNNQPKLLNLKEVLESFLNHRREVTTRRAVFELKKARQRGHILEGLAIALSNVDKVVRLIKESKSPSEAKDKLKTNPWASKIVEEMLEESEASIARPDGISPDAGLRKEGYFLSDAQAQRILEMQLQRLTALEKEKVISEYRDIIEKIKDLVDLLASPQRISKKIGQELSEVKNEYGDLRKSEIQVDAHEISMEDLIAPEDVVVTLSHTGYIKSQPLVEYRAQKRGGRGKQAADTKQDDFIDSLFVANSHDYILCFSNRGRIYWLKVYEVPRGGRGSRGKPVINLLQMAGEEKITAILPVKKFDHDQFVFMATAKGTVKKTPLSEFSRPRQMGIIAVGLDDGDFLVGAALTNGNSDIMLFSDSGKAARFYEGDVRPMGRSARGVRGMRLDKAESAMALVVINENMRSHSVLTATENGFGKRTNVDEFTRHGRGARGMIAIQTSQRNGKVVAARLVSTNDEIMLITTGGVLIRTRVKEIREMGRSTQGVKLINLGEDELLSGLEKVLDNEESDSSE